MSVYVNDFNMLVIIYYYAGIVFCYFQNFS